MPKEKLSQENIKNFLSEIPFYVVSNKGCYEYGWKRPIEKRYIVEKITAGGLATALNSIMEETGSTWITWASGTKDAEIMKLREEKIQLKFQEIIQNTIHKEFF